MIDCQMSHRDYLLLFLSLLCASLCHSIPVATASEPISLFQGTTGSKLNVTITGVFNTSFLVESGTTLNDVGNLSSYFSDKEFCVANGDNQPRIPFKSTDLVSRNMTVVVGRCMSVSVGAPINNAERMVVGEILEHLAWFFNFSLDEFIVVTDETGQVLNKTSLIEGDTALKLCHNVSVHNMLGTYTFLVEHQQPLHSNTDLVQCANRYHLAQSNQMNKNEVMLAHKVESHLDLVLCSIVIVTGVINTTMLVESGKQQLGDTILADFFNPINYYEVSDAKDFSRYYSFHDTINCDITVTITDKCGSFSKQRCINTDGMCIWNKNGVCSRDTTDENNNVGVVVGASVGGAVVVIAAVIIVAVILAKKKRRQKTEAELMSTGMFQTVKDTNAQ